MTPRDLLLMLAVNFVWALNVALGKVVLSDIGVPPLFYAGLRFLVVAMLLALLIRPVPRPLGGVVLAGLLTGALHFGFLFIGLRLAAPSVAAIILQMGVPFTAILSAVFLRERVTPLRITGIALAVAGVLLTVLRPGGAGSGDGALVGALALIGAAFSMAVGGIVIKRLPPIRPMQFQAWTSLLSFAPLLALSSTLETGQVETMTSGGWFFVIALGVSVFGVTIWAGATYFRMVVKYDLGVVAPLTLGMPLMTVAAGILFFGDAFNVRIALGMALALAGVFLVQRSGGVPAEVVREGAT